MTKGSVSVLFSGFCMVEINAWILGARLVSYAEQSHWNTTVFPFVTRSVIFSTLPYPRLDQAQAFI